MDNWQAGLIISEADKALQPPSANDSQRRSLAALSPSVARLLFFEASLLDHTSISDLLGSTISDAPDIVLSNVTNIGPSPVLIRLLRSQNSSRRNWALTQARNLSRRRLDMTSFVRSGTRDELEGLYRDTALQDEDKWTAVSLILAPNSLGSDALELGVIQHLDVDGTHRPGKSLLAVIMPLLGADTGCECG